MNFARTQRAKFLAACVLALAAPALAKIGATAEQARAFFGGRTGKVVYTKTFDRKLYFVDFSDSLLVEHKVSDDQYVLNPKISPDGSRVVYESYGVIVIRELVANSSQRFVVMNAPFQTGRFYEPHWWVHPVTGTEYISYSTGDPAEDAWPPKTGVTFLQRIVKNKPDTAATQLLPYTMGTGRSRNGKWGGSSNHSTGLFKLDSARLDSAYLDSKNWLDSGLTYTNCNPSINPSANPDHQSRMLHLGGGQYTLFGKVYDNHKAVIMRSWDDADIDHPVWYMGPLGDRVDNDSSGNIYWHNCEWSNNEDYFALNGSTIIDNWDSADVYLIKINFSGNSKLLRILQGGGVNISPDLWIKDGVQPARIRLDKGELHRASLRADTAALAPDTLRISNAGDGTLPGLQVGATPKWLKVTLVDNGTNHPLLINQILRDSVSLGEYRDTVAVTYGGGVDSATYAVTFSYRDPVLTTLEPKPRTAILLPGGQASLSALALDQIGDTLATQPTVTWSAPLGIPGFSAAGKYTADSLPPAPRGFLAVGQSLGSSGAVACTTEVRVARVWRRFDAGVAEALPSGSGAVSSAWGQAPHFTVSGDSLKVGRVPDSLRLDSQGTVDPAPDSVLRSFADFTGFRFAGLPKGRYRLRMGLVTAGRLDTASTPAWTLKLEGKTAFEGRHPKRLLSKAWSVVTAEAVVTVSDTDGMAGEFIGLSEAGLHVASLEIFDFALPPVTVLSPNGGESLRTGDTLRIRWNTDGNVVSVGIQISLDSGKKWIPVTRNSSVGNRDTAWGNYAWVLPDSLDSQDFVTGKAMIQVYDYFGSDRDRSDANFAIEKGPAALRPEGAALPRATRFSARWQSGAGLRLRGLTPGQNVDLALLDSRGRWAAAQRHVPVNPQGEALWTAGAMQAPRGVYRLWVRQGKAKHIAAIAVY